MYATKKMNLASCTQSLSHRDKFDSHKMSANTYLRIIIFGTNRGDHTLPHTPLASSIPTYHWVPEFTGNAQVLAAPHERIRLSGLHSFPVAEVELGVEGVLPHGLGHKPPQAVEGILAGDQLRSLSFILQSN